MGSSNCRRWGEVIVAEQLGTALVIDGAVTPRDGEAGYRVLVAHDPGVLPAAARADYDLVLAGHLHGGQVVLWEGPLRLYPGALVYRWNGLRFTRDRTTMLVSRGVADTVPLRWRCPRDVLVVTV